MKTEATFGRITVVANEWKGKRIYFSEKNSKSGAACWDIEKKQWIPVKTEWGTLFKNKIKAEWGL